MSARGLACAVLAWTLATGAAPALAQSAWTRVSEDPQGLVAVYAKAARREGKDHVRVDLLYNYRDVQQDPDSLRAHRSAVTSATVNCATPALRMGDMKTYAGTMGRGAIVEATRGAGAPFREAKPGTMDEALVQFACRQRQGQRSDARSTMPG